MPDRADERHDPVGLATEIRSVPRRARRVTQPMTDEALRHRPGVGEWSAIEVVGHLIDKMQAWHERARRTQLEDEPELVPYDQDAAVASANYQRAVLFDLHPRLTRACEEFARTVEALQIQELARPAQHGEFGQITLRECVTLPLDSVHDHLQQARNAASAQRIESI